MNWKDELHYFLESKLVFDNYIYNTKNIDFKEYYEYCKENPDSFISAAFGWTSSNEGYSFWEEIDNDWKEYYNYWKDIDDSDDVWVRTDMPVCATA